MIGFLTLGFFIAGVIALIVQARTADNPDPRIFNVAGLSAILFGFLTMITPFLS